MRRIDRLQIRGLWNPSSEKPLGLVKPSQLRHLIKLHTLEIVSKFERNLPNFYALGEAEAIYLQPITSISRQVMSQLPRNDKGEVLYDNFVPGSVIITLMDLGCLLNAATTVLLNMKTKTELDAFNSAKAMLSYFDQKPDLPGDPDKDRFRLITEFQKLLSQSDSIISWLGANPVIKDVAPGEGKIFRDNFLTSLVKYGGAGFIREVGISGIPEAMGKHLLILDTIRTLLSHDRSWMDGFALMLLYASYRHLTVDADAYSRNFVRVTNPNSAASASHYARLASQLGYHLLSCAYAPSALLFKFNYAMLLSEVETIKASHNLNEIEQKRLEYAKSLYKEFETNFSFNVVNAIYTDVMKYLTDIMGSNVIVGTHISEIIGDPMPPAELVVQNPWEELRSPIPFTRKEVPWDRARFSLILDEYIERLGNTADILNSAFQFSAVAGSSLNANALQLPDTIIPKSDIHDDVTIKTSSLDLEKMLKDIDRPDVYGLFPSRLRPIVWPKPTESDLSGARTVIDDLLYKYVNEDTLKSQLFRSILKQKIAYKWPSLKVPIAGLPIEGYATHYIPFNYVRDYSLNILSPRKMVRSLNPITSLKAPSTRNYVEELYFLTHSADSLYRTMIADSISSIGMLFHRDSINDKFRLVIPSVPFAYGLHLSVYLSKMGLSHEISQDLLATHISKGLKVFADNASTASDDTWASETDVRKMTSILIQYSYLPAPGSIKFMPGIMSYRAHFPVPVRLEHFSAKTPDIKVTSDIMYSTDWFFQTYNDLMNVSGKGNFSNYFAHGKSVADAISWEPHQGYSSFAAILPALTFVSEGTEESNDFILSLDFDLLFTKFYSDSLPYRRFIISSRDRNIIELQDSDYQAIRSIDLGKKHDQHSQQESIPSSIEEKKTDREVTTQELLNDVESHLKASSAAKIVTSSNPNIESPSSKEILDSALLNVGLEDIGKVVPPIIDSKEAKNIQSGTVTPLSDTEKFIGDAKSGEKNKKKNKRSGDSNGGSNEPEPKSDDDTNY